MLKGLASNVDEPMNVIVKRLWRRTMQTSGDWANYAMSSSNSTTRSLKASLIVGGWSKTSRMLPQKQRRSLSREVVQAHYLVTRLGSLHNRQPISAQQWQPTKKETLPVEKTRSRVSPLLTSG